MTMPTESTEQLLAAWRELEAERARRFKEKLDAGEAIRVRCILDEHGDEPEAQAKAIAALPEKDRNKSLGWIARRIIQPSPNGGRQDMPATPSASGPCEPISHSAPEPLPRPAHPPVCEPREGVVRIQTGEPDKTAGGLLRDRALDAQRPRRARAAK